MKLTKDRLQQIIKEELKKTLNENFGDRRALDSARVGDYVEIEISDDGYDKSIEIIDPKDYRPERGAYTSIKLLAKIEAVAGEEDEEAEAPSADVPNPMAQL